MKLRLPEFCNILFLLTFFTSTPTLAVTEIRLWHAMEGVPAQALERMVQRFNAQQPDIKVVTEFKGSYGEALASAIASTPGASGPHLLQSPDASASLLTESPGRIRSLHQLLHDTKTTLDTHHYYPAIAAAYADRRGAMLALPFNISTPVFVYNREAFRKAGLNPDQPPKTWRDVQAAALRISKSGMECAYTSGMASWVHLENLAAWHNEPFASNENGHLGHGSHGGHAKGGPRDGNKLVINGELAMRHLSLLSSWVKGGLFTPAAGAGQAERNFLNGECAMLTSDAPALREIAAGSNLDVAVAALPYYDEFSGAPFNTLAGGAALWAMAGKSSAENRATARFLVYLASPTIQAEWSEQTGYLPTTPAGTSSLQQRGWLGRLPGAQAALQQLSRKTQSHSRGLRLGDFQKIRAVLDQELNAVWQADKTPLEALDSAVTQSNLLLKAFEQRLRTSQPAAQTASQSAQEPATTTATKPLKRAKK
jgi:sn-glycerol 3-phosphate transport system substrate-binding protein